MSTPDRNDVNKHLLSYPVNLYPFLSGDRLCRAAADLSPTTGRWSRRKRHGIQAANPEHLDNMLPAWRNGVAEQFDECWIDETAAKDRNRLGFGVLPQWVHRTSRKFRINPHLSSALHNCAIISGEIRLFSPGQLNP